MKPSTETLIEQISTDIRRSSHWKGRRTGPELGDCTTACGVETVGIEPTSATARRAASTSVSGALYLVPDSPHRPGCRGPVRLSVPPFGADGPPGGDPASDSAGSRRGLRERRSTT